MAIEVSKGKLIDALTGEVIGDTTPRMTESNYEEYRDEFNRKKELRFLEPMTAKELEEEKLQEYLKTTKVIAEEKFDGHRGLLSITSKGNRMFSRRVSKKTGWYSENTDQMPHIRDLNVPEELFGTILDGEVLLPIENCTCRDVQSVTGALPETSIQHQIQYGFAFINAFDILYYKGVNIQKMPLWKRKVYLNKVVDTIKSDYIQMSPMYAPKETAEELKSLWDAYAPDDFVSYNLHLTNNFEEQFRQFLKENKEGLIIKDVNAPYEQKRSKAFVKMKAHKTYDVVIMDYEKPTKEYTGKELDSWEYFEDGEPVTKYYAMGWIGALVFGVYDGDALTSVGRTSGMDEETRKRISEDPEKYRHTVIEVEAQGIINKETGSLQHPRFIQFRPDKSPEMCTYQAHIRED